MIYQRAALREFANTASAVFVALLAILLTTQLIRLLAEAAGAESIQRYLARAERIDKLEQSLQNGEQLLGNEASMRARWKKMRDWSLDNGPMRHHHVYDPVDNVHIAVASRWKTMVFKFLNRDKPGKLPGIGQPAVGR